ncbi:MAG: hypothetical protein V7K48_11945 [Nostoc sp.]|uniref:hypothetical protein n=1 Tax=Nostoc sp. TaxID=1180 RepID=UPI002FF714CE
MIWRTVFIFVVLATLITVFVGWLTSIELLPISKVINYNDAGLRFIRVWIWLAIAIGSLNLSP